MIVFTPKSYQVLILLPGCLLCAGFVLASLYFIVLSSPYEYFNKVFGIIILTYQLRKLRLTEVKYDVHSHIAIKC